MKHLLTMMAALVLLSAPVFGQYTYSDTYTLVDNLPNCDSSSYSCEQTFATPGFSIALPSAGWDGTLYGLRKSGKYLASSPVYKYDLGNNGNSSFSWVEAATALQTAGGQHIAYISVANATQIMVLSAVLSPTPNVYVLSSAGTAWTAVPGSPWL